MAKCRDCRWYKVDVGNPMKGVCIKGTYQADEKEASSSTSGGVSVIPGSMVNGSDEACEHYEDKPSRKQRLKEGM